MDTLKSLAVITLMGAVLYGVYVVANKPDKPLSPEMEALANTADAPLIDDGHGHSSLSVPQIEAASSDSATADHRHSPSRTKLRSPGKRALSAPPRSLAEVPAPDAPGAGASADFVPPADAIGSSGPPETTAESSGVRRVKYETEHIPRDSVPEYPEASRQGAANKPNKIEIGSGASSGDVDAEIEASKARVRLYAFRQAWKTAQDQVSQGRHREALLALTPFYRDPSVPAQEQEELEGWLDALAAKVIYSTEHLLEPAYSARRGESLYTISEKYRVPYLLLKNINNVRDNDLLLPGVPLKVVRGPFRAEVDLTRKDITIFVQNLYAGRFSFTLGSDPVQSGEYMVRGKDPAKSYIAGQSVFNAKDPRNPYGGVFLDLGEGVSIHGSPGDAYADQRIGCIQLAPRDAEDLFAILSKDQSAVVIKE